MALPATLPSIRFLDTTGVPMDELREWTEAFIEVDIEPAGWEAARLTVNGTEQALSLRRLGGHVRVVANWPRANAGTYELRAELGSASTARHVTINPGKLSQDAFNALLSDLETRLPAAVAIALQRAGGLAGLAILPPEETTVPQEVARLRRVVQGSATRPGLAPVLHDLARDPHRVLKGEELWTRTHKARRPHPARLIHAVRAPANVLHERLPVRVIDQRVRPTVDVYENRVVRLFHDQVRLRLHRLERILTQSGNASSDAEGVAALRAELAAARREAAFLDEVAAPSHLPSRVTMVLLKQPAYRAAFEGYLELHRSIAVRLDEPALELPLENLPGLYQLWGTLVACVVLLEVAANRGYRIVHQRLVHRGQNEVFVRMMPPGKDALRLVHQKDGSKLTLTPERSFGSTGATRSVSFRQVPDITIAIERPGVPPELLLLDPKYKLDSDGTNGGPSDGRPKKVDIDKMHAYRDAIRDTEGRHLVTEACTIYPGPGVQYIRGVRALPGVPGRDHLHSTLTELISVYLRSDGDASAPGGPR